MVLWWCGCSSTLIHIYFICIFPCPGLTPTVWHSRHTLGHIAEAHHTDLIIWGSNRVRSVQGTPELPSHAVSAVFLYAPAHGRVCLYLSPPSPWYIPDKSQAWEKCIGQWAGIFRKAVCWISTCNDTQELWSSTDIHGHTNILSHTHKVKLQVKWSHLLSGRNGVKGILLVLTHHSVQNIFVTTELIQ